MTNPVYRPSQILRLIKQGKIDVTQPSGEGRIVCHTHGHPIVGNTSCPAFWENGMYGFCAQCNGKVLVKVHFREFSIDLSGERKSYPERLSE